MFVQVSKTVSVASPVQILRTCLHAFDVHFQCFSSGGVELSNVFADGFLCGQLLELACGSIEIGDDV